MHRNRRDEKREAPKRQRDEPKPARHRCEWQQNANRDNRRHRDRERTTGATNQIYFAHFAITDAKNNAQTASERFSRGATGLAGATGNPFRVWNASYYISFTRLETIGTITVDGEPLPVSGTSWMDHEWSTAVLGENAVGWDWFSIQLNDKREVMLFRIRQKDGNIGPLSSETIVEPDGTARHLTREQFDIKVLSTWTSNATRAAYPSRWTAAIPDEDIHLDLQPLVADQEMDVSIKYWEGVSDISGLARDAMVSGRGFVEMTGCAPQTTVKRKQWLARS
jgi:predicted secreted hydrolase